jgi:hypothetical protein
LALSTKNKNEHGNGAAAMAVPFFGLVFTFSFVVIK